MEGRSDSQLNTSQTVTADRILEVLQSQSPKEALRLVRQLEIIEQKGGLKADLKADQARLKVVALPLLPSSEIISIFQGDLRPVLEFNLNSRLKIRLVTAPAQVQDDIKNQILSTLETNNQPFVSGQIKSPADWLRSFREKGQSIDVFTKESSVFQALTIEDQLRVQRLLQIIEQTLTLSASDENMEDELMVKDEAGRFKVLKEGKLVDLGFEEIDESDRSQARAIPAVEVSAPPAQPLEEKTVPVHQAIAPPPPAIPKISPSFYFHTDDEKEVNRHRINLADLEPEAGTDLDVVVSQLIKDFDLKFPDEAIQTRFTSIIKSRLRDVRDLIETRNMLTRPIEVGGVGLSDKLVMEIIAQLEEESLKVHQPRPIQSKSQPVPPALPVEEKKPETITPPPPVEKAIPSPQRIAVESVSKPAPIQPKPQPIPVSPVPKREARPEPVKTPIVRRPLVTTRPTVSDIKPPVKTIGPIEELAELSLEDYRRLGDSLEESNEKIYEKLDLLEEDSYLKRAEGVKAWKKSPVHTLYLEIGRESMEKDMAVMDVIRQRREDGKPYLSQEEFQAIADLNKKISF